MKHASKITRPIAVTLPALVLALITSPAVFAAIPWDGDGGDGIWFNPANWNRNMNDNITLPPGGTATTPSTGDTDTEISIGTATLNSGMGVIYNPTPGAPHFPVPDSVNDPPGDFSYQKIRELYMSRAGAGQAFVTPDNTLTIMGDLELTATMVVGRSSGSLTTPTNARINQLGGLVKVHNHAVDLGQREGGTRIGFGNGTYDYRGGRLEASLNSPDFANHGIRLAAGGSAGSGGVGRFIMHNPSTPGYVRALNFSVAAHAGLAGSPNVSPNGSTIGVGIVEFHYENSGTRPIQVSRNLIINNGAVTTGTRSARLDLVLDEAVQVDGGGIPETLGLFDVDFAWDPLNSGLFTGAISGTGGLGLVFSNADGTAQYTEGSVISATFGSTTYNWNITYAGNIIWANQSDADNGIVQSISATGGTDVVLVGLSSISTGLTGDYNKDGTVDAADYVTWRKTDSGNAQGYTDWVENFGESQPGSGGGNAAVPEPASIVLALLCLTAVSSRRQR